MATPKAKTATKPAAKIAAKPTAKATTTNTQWVFLFSDEKGVTKAAKSWQATRELLGGKGAGLFDMTRKGLPVPPGFTLSTEVCDEFVKIGKKLPQAAWEQALAAMKVVEKQTGKQFGGTVNPLLVSCRSGARESMPGMMETVLNVGLNDVTVEIIAKLSNNPRFAYDSYRRLLMMYGATVMGLEDALFDAPLDHAKEARGTKLDTELTTDDLKSLVATFKGIIKDKTGKAFPQDVYEQLKGCAMAVFNSATGHKAREYAKAMGWKATLPTAVNVCTMVFGNMGDDSATGVAFTRDPSTGEKVMLAEYLTNAQGEDVVAGVRTPKPIIELKTEMPKSYKEFMAITGRLEKTYANMQDCEFTIEKGKLWFLQTRNGKRTAKAAIKMAVDMAKEKLITKDEALKRVTPNDVDSLLHPQFEEKSYKAAKSRLIAKGVNASPGAAVGVLAFDADLAAEWGKQGKAVIMIRPETKPDDVHGMVASKGILTSRGGATSHAAVVARQFGIPCVCGAEDLNIDMNARTVLAGGVTLKEGDWASLDGAKGEAFSGKIDTVVPKFEEQHELIELLSWADEISKRMTRTDEQGKPRAGLQVWANADYPKDAIRAVEFGAKGIGLCRTEHMFFEEVRLPVVQRMILAKDNAVRDQALSELLPFQRSDFEGLFRAMRDPKTKKAYPVIIRLIDPPLHEFLPAQDDLIKEVTALETKQNLVGLNDKETKELHTKRELLSAVSGMHEQNPMMGLRGIRLGIMLPGLISMQVRAIFEAACDLKKAGLDSKPEVMIPLTGHVNELKRVQPELESVAKQVMKEKGVKVDYKFGTMIEVPRAALTAGELAEVAQFFSVGSNDLSQFCLAASRDDAEKGYLIEYVNQGILPTNPFQHIDENGVGRLMSIAIKEGRAVRPDLEFGICGEHGGDPDSIDFCYRIGNDYVSCSPFRVPIARLAAAHSALKTKAK